MNKNYCIYSVLVVCYLFLPLNGNSQDAKNSISQAAEPVSQEKGLFTTDDVLEIRLSGDIRELLNDISDKPQLHHLRLSYRQKDSSVISIPVDAKTRGNFRRLSGNCYYPPILLQFPKGNDTNTSIFKGENKLKLVMPCKGDQYIIYEWLVYRLYNVITPKSFRARLVRLKLENKNGKESSPFYGILLEEEKQMAQRNGAVSIKKVKLAPQQTETESFLVMAMFEYLIGNTDWCVQYMQNIKLIAVDSTSVPTAVPYDFDMSGIVNSPYAKPAEELRLSSCRERRYRGYCILDMQQFDKAIELYNNRKEEIYSIYTKCTLLDAKYIKSTVKFLDEFYATINNPKALEKAFGYPCDKSGTGNVLIKGLRED